MRRPLRAELSAQQVTVLWRRLGVRDLVPNERTRLECVRLVVQGHTAPEIASPVEKHVVTVRMILRRFLDGGFEGLADAPRPGRPSSWRCEDRYALEEVLDEAAAWG